MRMPQLTASIDRNTGNLALNKYINKHSNNTVMGNKHKKTQNNCLKPKTV